MGPALPPLRARARARARRAPSAPGAPPRLEGGSDAGGSDGMADRGLTGSPGTPGPIRTGDMRLRRPPLYPAELRAQAEGHARTTKELRCARGPGPGVPREQRCSRGGAVRAPSAPGPALTLLGAGRAVGGGAVTPARLTTRAADLGHVLAVLAHGLAALAACGGGLVGRELVSTPLRVGRLSALARNFLLLFTIHRGKAPIALLRCCSHF